MRGSGGISPSKSGDSSPTNFMLLAPPGAETLTTLSAFLSLADGLFDTSSWQPEPGSPPTPTLSVASPFDFFGDPFRGSPTFSEPTPSRQWMAPKRAAVGSDGEMDAEKPTPHEVLAPYLAEFTGTVLLTFGTGCCILCGDARWTPVGVALILMVSIYGFAPVSGGQLNPSVSLALLLSDQLTFNRLCGAWASQLLGGLIGAAACVLVFDKFVEVQPAVGFGWWEVCIVESIFTAMLCFVFLSCMASKRNNPEKDHNQFYALAIGFVMVAGGYAAGPVSGSLFNPAVTLGLTCSSGSPHFWWCFQYIAYQAFGSLLAAALFRITRPDEFSGGVHSYSLPTQMASEFIGAWVLTFTVGLSTLGSSPLKALSSGACAMCMIYSLHDISPGLFNPAATLALVLIGDGRCSPESGLKYAAVQFAGALCAAFVYADIFHQQTFPLEPEGNLCGDCVFTCLLALTALFVGGGCEGEKEEAGDLSSSWAPAWTMTRTRFHVGLAIGMCYAVGALAGTTNPAVTFGVWTVSAINGSSWWPCPKYVAIELLGGLLAAASFHVTHARLLRGGHRKALHP